jgi:DNA-nicking Smr family endonuclease
MSRDGNRRRGLSYEERALWTTVTKAIEPLRAKPSMAPAENSEAATEISKPAIKSASKSAAKPATKPAHAQSHAVKTAPAAPAPEPQTPLSRRMRARVARGKQAIDARLDLHGALLRFLRNAGARDARLVLVITGKGRGPEPGVLRRQVPQWLGLPEFRAFVIGFEDAHVAHGGEGALYVRIRKSKCR